MDSRKAKLSFGIDKILSRDLSSNECGDVTLNSFCTDNSALQAHLGECEDYNIHTSCLEFHPHQYPYISAEGLPFHHNQRTSGNFSNIIKPAPVRPIAPVGKVENSCRRRSWSRAVFSSLQRKGLEKRFAIQKYITKPDRRQLAATLGLTDAQVKVWFQNRRMKWRHTKENGISSTTQSTFSSTDNSGFAFVNTVKEAGTIENSSEFGSDIEIS